VNDPLRPLRVRIRTELVELERVLRRVEEGWQRAQHAVDDDYLDSVALNLHGFYSGLERIFERIAVVVDGSKPTGENWHQALLEQMTTEVFGVRPAVISDVTREPLDAYRGFRHVVRNVYTCNFDPAKVGKLVVDAPKLLSQVQAELLAFTEFLEEQA
jgi:hypothetical protein